jgi:large subunit ribosomal protein L19
MALQLITEIEKSQMKDNVPSLNVGDTVRVAKLIVEGKKQRTQYYEGLIVKIANKYSRESITVRKICDGIGIEKSFLLHSPLVTEINVIKCGKVRRARLNYLRNRIGVKATRVKTKKSKV